MPKPIAFLSNRFQFSSIFHDGMIPDDRTKEFKHRQQEKIPSAHDRNAALEISVLRTQKAYITNMNIAHGQEGNNGHNIGCVDNPIDRRFEFNVIVAVTDAWTAKRVTSCNHFPDVRIMFQSLCSNRSERRP